MLIIPLPRKLSLATFPFMTVLLLIVNVFVYFAWQLPDARVTQNFAQAYVKSGLAKQELPVYVDWLSANPSNGRPTPAPTASELANPKYQAAGGVALQHDGKFQRDLPALMQKALAAEPYVQWQTRRAEVDRIWQQHFTDRYMFVPAKATTGRAETYITHMFMHGGLGHLLGNMLMLILIGLLVEPAVGAWRTAAIYLAGGLGAVGLHLVFSMGSWTGALGASGAIAAMMGACAALYGLRKVRFFYHLLFYFNFIVLPAIVVLPLWIANELWQWLHLRHVSNVAYFMHVGGLIAGAAFALLFRKKAALEFDSANLPSIEQEENISKLHARAYASLKKMQLDTAAREFEQLLQLEPDNIDYAQQLYTSSRSAPASARYHHAAMQLMRLSAKSNAIDLLAKTVTEYRKNAMPLPRWTSEDVARYTQLLAKSGQRGLAATLADTLLKLPLAQIGNANLAEVAMTLAVACHRAGNELTERERYLKVLETRFPGSEQLKLARQFVTR
jgi:membrane associated rhomboid family serine protease